jgi:isoaspartyl peptidase/L-asparaginase-like protein (Ntn-hydrolase superfamily)
MPVARPDDLPGPTPSRRQLLATGGALLAAASLAACTAPAVAPQGGKPDAGAEPQPTGGLPPRPRRIVSTWWFGQAANAPAWERLLAGGSPLDACEAGVRVTEADPAITSVGYGGAPNADGVVELDASVMRGDTLQCGGVAALRNVMHPVSVARLVMERTPHVLLVGEGALAFARAQGVPEQDLLTPESRNAWEAWRERRVAGAQEPWERARTAAVPAGADHDHDTIGMIAADRGRLAVAVTTSGLAYKLSGRVGDSPLIGAGSYCDDEAGAAVSTGVGEEVIRVGGCVAIVEALRRGMTPRRAGLYGLQRVRRAMALAGRSGDVAFLVASRDGAVWGGALTDNFSYAVTDDLGTRLVRGEVLV